MSSRAHILCLALAAVAAVGTALADDSSGYARKQLNTLLVDDALKTNATVHQTPPAVSPTADPDLVQLQAYVVHSDRIPVAHLAPYETPFYHFLKTGNFLNVYGKRVSTRIGLDGARNAANGGKARLNFQLIW